RLLEATDAARWRFRHGLVRDSVYEHTTGMNRVRVHARILETLAADPSIPLQTVAHHAIAARPIVDAERAATLAADAGREAFAQHAYEEAGAWFDRALVAAPPATSPHWRAELLVRCGEASRHIGDIERARDT